MDFQLEKLLYIIWYNALILQMRKSRPVVIKLPKGRSKLLEKIIMDVRILNFHIVYISQEKGQEM